MQLNSGIRDQVDTDAAGIAEVTVTAFRTLAISRRTEQFIIEAFPQSQQYSAFSQGFPGRRATMRSTSMHPRSIDADRPKLCSVF
jgi:hypothetical protein